MSEAEPGDGSDPVDERWARAPGKLNLSLYLGPTRPDGYHELVSAVVPAGIVDEVTLAPAPARATGDEVVCEGIEGENLALRALAAFRAATGWDAPPQRVTIEKHIPVAAGMGGGSSDAAATLRLAAEAAHHDGDLKAIAFEIGADVPVLLDPRPALMEGAGERISELEGAPPYSFVIAPSTEQLSTPAVFAEADRLGLTRDAAALASARERVLTAPFDPATMINDLQPAAISLCPSIAGELERLRAAGALHAMVTGSGPTVFGVFEGLPSASRLAPHDVVAEYFVAFDLP